MPQLGMPDIPAAAAGLDRTQWRSMGTEGGSPAVLYSSGK